MKIAIILLLTAQLFGADAKNEATEHILGKGMFTARVFELAFEKYEDKYDAYSKAIDATGSATKRKILAENADRHLATTKKGVEEKWSLPIVNFEKAEDGSGGMLASSPITVVGDASLHYFLLEPVLVEWKVVDVENENTLVAIGTTTYSKAMLLGSQMKFNQATIRVRNYPTRDLVTGSTVKFDTLAYYTGIEKHYNERIMCFTLFSRAAHNAIVKRGKAEGVKRYEEKKDSIDRLILDTGN